MRLNKKPFARLISGAILGGVAGAVISYIYAHVGVT
jgi:hypothetical protein